MNFMDSLAANPSGSSGIYGQPRQNTDQDELAFYNRIKDREFEDFQRKANFMSDLSLKQDRLRNVFNPAQQPQQSNQPMNVVMGKDPNMITGYQKADLGMKQQGMDLERQKMGQTNRLGQQALDIKAQQGKLNQQKSDQISALKQADMERKISEAEQRFNLAKQGLDNKNTTAEERIQLQKELAAAAQARHDAEMKMKDSQFKITNETHLKTIAEQEKELEQAKHTKTTTKLNEDGTEKVVTTEKGSAAKKVNIVDSNGKVIGSIPEDQVDNWKANHSNIGSIQR